MLRILACMIELTAPWQPPDVMFLDHLPWPLLGSVLARLDPAARRQLLGGQELPRCSLLEFVLTRGSAADRLALVETGRSWTRHRHIQAEILTRLGQCEDPKIAEALVRHPHANRETVVRALTQLPFSAADLDDDVTAFCLAESADAQALVAVVQIEWFGTPLADVVAMRALANLWRVAGREAVTSAYRGGPTLSGEYGTAVDTALVAPDGLDMLDRATAEAGRTAILLQHLRSGYGARLALMAPHAPLDWAEITQAHRQQPLPPETLLALAYEPGCPDRIIASTLPPVDRTTPHRHAPGLARELLRDLSACSAVEYDHVVGACKAGVLTAEFVLEYGSPAWLALGVLRETAQEQLRNAHTALRRLTRALGDNPNAWVAAFRLLPEFTGTVRELADTVRTMAPGE